jgi:hypothetical protein
LEVSQFEGREEKRRERKGREENASATLFF